MTTEPSTLEVPIMEDSHNFFKVARTQTFVDKSLMIETAFKSNHRLLITAPSKFGKSTNLHMMKCFLSDRSNRAESEVFKNLGIYKRGIKFFKQHFHKYQVLFVDLTSGKSASYNDALDAYRWAIHNTFQEHEYLLRTSVLKASEEKIISSWCDMNRGYKIKQKEDMVNDLSLLVEVLARYGGNNVVVLVDEYDSIINKAMYEGKNEKEFNDICVLTTDVLQSLLRENTMVKLVMVCGTSIIAANGIQRLYKIDPIYFLSPQFFQFYGLMKDELKIILNRHDFMQQLINVSELSMWYGGYTLTNNDEVFNIFSVLKSLKNRKRCPYWPIQYQVEQFINLSRSPNIARIIHQLLIKKCVYLEIPDGHKPLDVKSLRQAYSQNVKNIENLGTLVYHLREIGIFTLFIKRKSFTNPRKTSSSVSLCLHNSEVSHILSHYFQSYLIQNCNIPANYYRTNYMKFVTHCQTRRKLQLDAIFYDAIV